MLWAHKPCNSTERENKNRERCGPSWSALKRTTQDGLRLSYEVHRSGSPARGAGARSGDARSVFSLSLEQGFQPSVTRFHSVFHAGRKHGGSRLSIGEGHAHGHSSAVAIRIESGFDVVVRRWIGQVHALDVDNLAVGVKFEIFAGDMKSGAFAVGPLVADLAACVLELPAEFRETVVLCLLEEMSYEEAAR